jgi:diketogulonate reductase-like aldo/keto reductase
MNLTGFSYNSTEKALYGKTTSNDGAIKNLVSDSAKIDASKARYCRIVMKLGNGETSGGELYFMQEGDTNWKDVDLDTWRAMEELYAEGKIKGIGLSNFLPHHLDNILNNAKVMPLVNQLEVHPGYSQEAAVAYCKSKEILVQAWSPLGRSNVLQHPILLDMAEKYNKSVAQLCLRFLLQKQIIPLVKASSMERMKENMDIFDFEISAEDISILEYMPQDMWQKEHPDFAIPKAKSNFEQ